MKKRRLMNCLVAGVLLLAVSAAAAFGSVNGYSRYKDAVMALALQEENFSAVGTMQMTVDGNEIWTMGAEYGIDGHEYATHISMTQGGQTMEEWAATVGDEHIWFDSSTPNTYRSYSDVDDGGPYNVLGFEEDDEYSARLIDFMEVAADTVVGELKNNFVQIGTEDGADLYQVDIAQAQVPSLVNAGLSLFAYALSEDSGDIWRMEYEDYNAVVFAYYEETTGETLPQEFKDGYGNGSSEWYEANQEMVSKFEGVCYGEGGYWGEKYDKVLEDNNGGVVYVYADGSYDYYADLQTYVADHPEEADNYMLELYVGEDMVLENVHCTFGVDADGRLTENQIAVTFLTTGADGSHHELVISGEVTLTDYGTTTITMPDLTGRTKLN